MSTTTTRRPGTPRPAGVDPRIRARRIEVRRQRGRRRLRLLLGLTVALGLLGLGLAAAFSALLDVDALVVRGAQRTAPDDIVAASGVVTGDPLVTLDGDGAARAIEQLPWVASASLGRAVDGTVTIEVVERVPVATLPVSNGGWVAVDAEGRQLALVDTPGPEELVMVGVEASGVVGEPVGVGAQSVLRLVAALTPAVREAVSAIGLDGDDLVLDLARGARVRLGEPARLDEKLVALETVLSRVDLRCLGELDLTVPSAPALTRVSPPGGDPAAALSDLSTCP